MNSYEGMFIFKPDLSKDNLDKTLAQVRDIIAKHNGSASDIKELGRQKLAYPIKKEREGFYYLINFHIDPEAVSKIKKTLALNESILRMMIIKRA
jgi:small subunit ribosomal protein S6